MTYQVTWLLHALAQACQYSAPITSTYSAQHHKYSSTSHYDATQKQKSSDDYALSTTSTPPIGLGIQTAKRYQLRPEINPNQNYLLPGPNVAKMLGTATFRLLRSQHQLVSGTIKPTLFCAIYSCDRWLCQLRKVGRRSDSENKHGK